MEFLAEALGFFDPGNNVVTYVANDGEEDNDSHSTRNETGTSSIEKITRSGEDTAEDEVSSVAADGEREVSSSSDTVSPPLFGKRDQSTKACCEVAAPSISLAQLIRRTVIDRYTREVSSRIAETTKVASPHILRRLLARRVVKQCSNGDTFSGLVDAVSGELLHGRCTCSRTGEIYEGPFLHGKRHGNGAVATRLDGSKFLGSYHNGHPYEGTLITSSFTYQGQLAPTELSPGSAAVPRAIFHGPCGTLIQKNGDVYEGDFKRGKYHGYGSETTASGLTYCGDYNHGKWHGTGELTIVRRRPLQRRTETDITNSEEHSDNPPAFNKNVFRYKYSGDWKHGEREGHGREKILFGLTKKSVIVDDTSSVRSRQDGGRGRTAIYEGKFHKDRRNGHGMLTLPDGTELEGTWKCGLPVTTFEQDERDTQTRGDDDDETVLCHNLGSSNGPKSTYFRRKKRKRPYWRITYPNLDMYQGDCADTGFSIENPEDGMRSHLHIDVSTFLTLVPNGRGVMIYGETLDVYAGEFCNGKRHGYGRCIYRHSGEEYDGKWENDVPINMEEKRLRLFQPYFDYHSDREGRTSHTTSLCPRQFRKISANSKMSLLKRYAGLSLKDPTSLVPSGESSSERDVGETSSEIGFH